MWAATCPFTFESRWKGNQKKWLLPGNAIPKLWDQKSERANGKGEFIKELNNHLTTLKVKVFEARLSLIENNKPVTAESIKNLLTGKVEKSKMVLDVFKYHNEQLAGLLNSDYSPSTLKRYITSLKHTHSFIKWKYGVEDIEISSLDYEFITEYEFWLKSVRKCNHNSAMKYIRNFRKIINGCIRRGWLSKDPFNFRKDLAISSRNVGQIYQALGEGQKALEFFEKKIFWKI